MAAHPKSASPAAAEDSAPVVGLPPREAAIELLQAGLEKRGGFEEAMNRPPFSTLPQRDRAWARALAATAFRRLGPIDAILAARLQKPPPERVRSILILGLVQLLHRDTPAFAAVATSVQLAEANRGSRPLKGLVNAVLRGVGRDPPPEAAPEEHLPPWLAARWGATYGQETMRAIAAAVPAEPPTDVTPRDPADAGTLAPLLQAEPLPGGSLRSALRGELAEWPGFKEGRWWVQDFAAAIPARLLDVKPGETALDLCAAPGGKTLQLAAAGAEVVAVDRSASRLKRLRENLARVDLKAEVVVADAAAWTDERQFDAVLLDAPCTATGTFRRHPDVLWAAAPGDIVKLAALQTRLLDAAAVRVRPGGRLVYCVCSLEPEEGEMQAAAFLARRPDFRLAPIAAGEGGAPAAGAKDGTLRLHPGLADPAGGMDGFFIARFVRA
jgi:16S rRNA (cytosine967-C5)-methyltransferase